MASISGFFGLVAKAEIVRGHKFLESLSGAIPVDASPLRGVIPELHRQGLKVAAIAGQLSIDRKTRGLEPPTYGLRPNRQKSIDPFLSYLRERLAAFPGLTAIGQRRAMRERYYTAAKRVRKARQTKGLLARVW